MRSPCVNRLATDGDGGAGPPDRKNATRFQPIRTACSRSWHVARRSSRLEAFVAASRPPHDSTSALRFPPLRPASMVTSRGMRRRRRVRRFPGLPSSSARLSSWRRRGLRRPSVDARRRGRLRRPRVRRHLHHDARPARLEPRLARAREGHGQSRTVLSLRDAPRERRRLQASGSSALPGLPGACTWSPPSSRFAWRSRPRCRCWQWSSRWRRRSSPGPRSLGCGSAGSARGRGDRRGIGRARLPGAPALTATLSATRPGGSLPRGWFAGFVR